MIRIHRAFVSSDEGAFAPRANLCPTAPQNQHSFPQHLVGVRLTDPANAVVMTPNIFRSMRLILNAPTWISRRFRMLSYPRNRADRGASHLFQNAEDNRVLGIVVKTYTIAMLTMQFRRYIGIRVCVALLCIRGGRLVI